MAQMTSKNAAYSSNLTPESRRQSLPSSPSFKDGTRTPPRDLSPFPPSHDLKEPECIRQKHFAAKMKAQRRYSQQMQANMGRLPGPMPSPFFTFHMPTPNQHAKQVARAGKKPRVSAPAVTNPFFRLYPDSAQPFQHNTVSAQPPMRRKLLETPLDLPSSDDITPVALELAEDEIGTDDDMRGESPAYQVDDPFEH